MAEKTINVAEVLAAHVGWLNGDKNGARGQLDNVRFGGMTLRNMDLRDISLREADLSGCDLSGTNLEAANLGGANLRGATLQGANLRHADVSNGDLRGAHLEGAVLTGVDAWRANLLGAVIGLEELHALMGCVLPTKKKG